MTAGARFAHLFSPLALGGVEVGNRIFSTGHMTMLAREGRVTPDLVAYHAARAAGGAGLIVVEAAAVHPTAVRGPGELALVDDGCIPGYRGIAQACHAHGTKVLGQLFHPGREMKIAPDGSAPIAYAPSATRNERFRVIPTPMTVALIRDVVAGYGDAARRLEAAGLDGAEIVASMGYLPAQFLNPRVNLREDEYGGGLENRLRFLREAVADIRAKTGGGFALGIRISGDEIGHDGLDPDEIAEICAAIDGDGMVDFFNVIGGSSASYDGSVHVVPGMAMAPAYLAPFAGAIRALVTKPVLVAGRINDPRIAERVIAQGEADMCGMTRAMICDPEMANKAAAGRADDIRACIGCNQACIGHEQGGYPVSCIQHPETGRERAYGARAPAARRLKVLVAGGGPAGMKAAAVAAERGHDVTLHEASARLGGQVLLAQLLPGRAEFGGIVTNLAREMERAGVRVVTGARVDHALVAREAPDAVILATGARPHVPQFEGAEEAHVVDAWRVLSGEANIGASVVIADWRCDWIGLGLAEKLARDGCRVRLCVPGTVPGLAIQQYLRDQWMGVIHTLGVEVIPYTRLHGADRDAVYFQHTTSGEAVVCDDADTLVLALGHERVADLEGELAGYDGAVHAIGDCVTPRTAEEAVLEGLKVAAAL